MRTLLIAAGAIVAAYIAVVLALVVAGRRTAAREVALLLPNLALLLKRLLADERVPRSSKLLVLLALGWIASPIDLVPEFVPFLGPLDDAVVVALVLRRVVRSAGRTVVEEHWSGDPATIARILRLAGATEG